MSKLYDRIRGTVRAEICGAFPEAVLNACALNAIELWELECIDAYTIRLTVFEQQLEELKAVTEGSMCDIKVLSHRGGSRNRRFLLRRKWLLISAVLAAALLTFSSLFIWEIEITGCDRLTEGQVLRALEDCGVTQGTYWPGISTDLVRSRMLTELPEIAWMTVNVSGSRAMVLISERQEKPEIYSESNASDIIAGKTGIISKMSVLNGKPVVTKGQSVIEGEILVSGLVDSITNAPRQVRAQAEIMADTWYELTAVCPVEVAEKAEADRTYSRFALRFGKRRINFYFGSGKHIDEYDKIVYEYNLGLDGMFVLPVTVIREELTRWESVSVEAEQENEMKEQLYTALQEQIEGEIVSSTFSVSRSAGLLHVTLRAQCYEDIALNADLAAGGSGQS